MSYCRWSPDSSVYVYPGAHAIVCCACSLDRPSRSDFSATRRSDMLAHLEAHHSAGDRVPERATQRLKQELQTLGDGYQPDGIF